MSNFNGVFVHQNQGPDVPALAQLAAVGVDTCHGEDASTPRPQSRKEEASETAGGALRVENSRPVLVHAKNVSGQQIPHLLPVMRSGLRSTTGFERC